MMKSPQLFSTIPLKLDFKEIANNRARLNTGYFCNYKCEFCYYKDRLSERDNLDIIKQRIDDIENYGIDEIDLSGGESSIEPNWFNILDYCKQKNFKNISTLSHGGYFSNFDFLKKSKDHGLNEILFSLHGATKEIHEKITGINGSFDKIIQAIKNAKELNIIVRINCTVYDLNHKLLEKEYIDLLKELNPIEVNFITLRYDTDNNNFRFNNYKDVTDSIKICIDNIKNDIKYINVRYTPYCYMIGYEKYVCNYYQTIFDIYDWNLALYNHTIDTSKKYTKEEKLQHSYDAAKHFRITCYHKNEECSKCKYFYICDGVENQLKDTKLIPIIDKAIYDINYYRKNFYE